METSPRRPRKETSLTHIKDRLEEPSRGLPLPLEGVACRVRIPLGGELQTSSVPGVPDVFLTQSTKSHQVSAPVGSTLIQHLVNGLW